MMIKRLAISIILFLSVIKGSVANANDIKGVLQPKDERTVEISPGDNFHAVFQIWPNPFNDTDFFKGFEGNKFLDLFYVLKVEDVRTSPNNHEVLEVFMHLIALRSFKNLIDKDFTHKETIVNVVFKKIKISNQEIKEIKSFNLLKQEDFNIPKKWWPIIIGIVLVLLIVSFLVFKKMRSKMKTKRIEEEKRRVISNWDQKFTEAKEREHFEELYKTREEWMELLENRPQSVFEFINCVKIHQYKKSWSGEELVDIENRFHEIRKVFNRE
jgi:hypothetical protein